MKSRITAVVLTLLITPLTSQAQWLKTMKRLPDTGQNTSYTLTFGEDNDYYINMPYFIDNGDGTVTDTITGLMWQKADGGEMTIENAEIYADTLTLAGYNDWRLPLAKESFSILNQQLNNPALDPNYFTNSAAEYWWTSQRQANDSLKVWVTNAGGGVGNHPKSETLSAGGTKKFHVRSVRDVTTPSNVATHFSNNLNGTVLDNLTGLMWQQISYFDSLDWESALTYADTCSLAGFNDWRLPNIKEMESINDEGLVTPSVDTVYFPNIGLKKYWSSTSLPNQTTKAWYFDTRVGITTYNFKITRLNLLLVRGDGNPQGTSLGETSPMNHFRIFPNPFHDQLNVVKEHEGDMISLMDLAGKVYFEGSNISDHDFSSLASGPYLIRISGIDPMAKMIVKE